MMGKSYPGDPLKTPAVEYYVNRRIDLEPDDLKTLFNDLDLNAK